MQEARAGVGGPCMVRANTLWLMTPVDRQTLTSENITFQQSCWLAEKISSSLVKLSGENI